jgi:Ala-tRNA(Pro) deacylase
MPIPAYISRFLDSENIAYQACRHSPAYTAQGIAQAQHLSGKHIAKVVMVMVDDSKMIMAALPANYRVDLDKLGHLLSAQSIRLATEEEFKDVFAECEIGAMPPLGNLYHMDVWVDESLKSNAGITFNAGTHADVIQMAYADFERLVQPRTGSFGVLLH